MSPATSSPPSPATPETVERLLRVGEVAELVALGRRTIWKWASAGSFPKPVSLGPTGRMKRWRESEIRAWMAAQGEVTR